MDHGTQINEIQQHKDDFEREATQVLVMLRGAFAQYSGPAPSLSESQLEMTVPPFASPELDNKAEALPLLQADRPEVPEIQVPVRSFENVELPAVEPPSVELASIQPEAPSVPFSAPVTPAVHKVPSPALEVKTPAIPETGAVKPKLPEMKLDAPDLASCKPEVPMVPKASLEAENLVNREPISAAFPVGSTPKVTDVQTPEVDVKELDIPATEIVKPQLPPVKLDAPELAPCKLESPSLPKRNEDVGHSADTEAVAAAIAAVQRPQIPALPEQKVQPEALQVPLLETAKPGLAEVHLDRPAFEGNVAEAPIVPLLPNCSENVPDISCVATVIAAVHCPQTPDVLPPQVQGPDLKVPDMAIVSRKLPELALSTPALVAGPVDPPQLPKQKSLAFSAPAVYFPKVAQPAAEHMPLPESEPVNIIFQLSPAPAPVEFHAPIACEAKVQLPGTDVPRTVLPAYQISVSPLTDGKVEQPAAPEPLGLQVSAEIWNLSISAPEPVDAQYQSPDIRRTPVPDIGAFPPPPEPPEIISGKKEAYMPPEIPAPENIRENIDHILQLWKSEHRIS